MNPLLLKVYITTGDVVNGHRPITESLREKEKFLKDYSRCIFLFNKDVSSVYLYTDSSFIYYKRVLMIMYENNFYFISSRFS